MEATHLQGAGLSWGELGMRKPDEAGRFEVFFV